MDARLKEWVTKKHDELPQKEKRIFLRTLKFHPEITAKVISENLVDWGTLATFKIGGGIHMRNIDLESAELVEHFKQHFAKELEAIQPIEKPDEPRQDI